MRNPGECHEKVMRIKEESYKKKSYEKVMQMS